MWPSELSAFDKKEELVLKQIYQHRVNWQKSVKAKWWHLLKQDFSRAKKCPGGVWLTQSHRFHVAKIKVAKGKKPRKAAFNFFFFNFQRFFYLRLSLLSGNIELLWKTFWMETFWSFFWWRSFWNFSLLNYDVLKLGQFLKIAKIFI